MSRKTRIDNPHVAIDGGHHDQSGPAGECRGHIHASCPKEGVTHQCALCGHVETHDWDAIDGYAGEFRDRHEGHLDAVPMPPCPKCGGQPFLNNSNVMYGLEQPGHFTLRAIHEHILERPRLRGRFDTNTHAEHERWQGEDYSHLPAKRRPDHHRAILGVESPT